MRRSVGVGLPWITVSIKRKAREPLEEWDHREREKGNWKKRARKKMEKGISENGGDYGETVGTTVRR